MHEPWEDMVRQQAELVIGRTSSVAYRTIVRGVDFCVPYIEISLRSYNNLYVIFDQMTIQPKVGERNYLTKFENNYPLGLRSPHKS